MMLLILPLKHGRGNCRATDVALPCERARGILFPYGTLFCRERRNA